MIDAAVVITPGSVDITANSSTGCWSRTLPRRANTQAQGLDVCSLIGGWAAGQQQQVESVVLSNTLTGTRSEIRVYLSDNAPHATGLGAYRHRQRKSWGAAANFVCVAEASHPITVICALNTKGVEYV